MLIIGLEGLTLSSADSRRLESPFVSGVILFSRNYESLSQLSRLTSAIRSLRPDCLITVDQEGGRVMRFIKDFSPIPPMSVFGESWLTKGPSEAKQDANAWARTMASELIAVGVDLSLSPVVDLGINQSIIGSRAFHIDPQIVAELASSWIDGMHLAGMKSVLKHFPGHGSVEGDTHLDWIQDFRSWEDIQKADLVPFQTLIHQKKADGIMMSHVVYPKVDESPAGFSNRWIQIARKTLDFKGILLSDDLGMQAAKSRDAKNSSPVERALLAGCDAVLLCNEFQGMDRAIDWAKHGDWKPKNLSVLKSEKR